MVHPGAGDKHALFRQTWSPGGVQSVRLGSDVEQNEELNATPGAQEGQDGRRGRVGGVEGEEVEVAVQESLFFVF